MRILIVEDSPTQAEHLSFVLEEMGHEVATARDGAAALNAIETSAPDLVISDINMPHMGGYELCQHIKSNPATQDLPVILLTSRRDPMDIFRALECGADNYFTKPWKTAILERRVRALDPQVHVNQDSLAEAGIVEFEFMGERRSIDINPARLLRLLLASLEDMLETNQELEQSQRELSEAKARLEAYTGTLEEKVQISEELAHRIMDSLEDAIITVDDSGSIKSFNKAAEGMFKIDAEGVPPNIADLLEESLSARARSHFSAGGTVADGEIIGPGAREIAGRATDNVVFPMDIVVTPMTLPEQKQYVLAIRDITERKETEERLHQAQKMEAVGQLTGGVAHDFNNLLTVIIGNLRLALKNGELPETLRKRCNSALTASERGADLTRQLLAFSRRQVLEAKLLNLNDNLKNVVDMLQRTLGETVELNVKASNDLRATRIDPAQFESALLNLAVNARDAMPKGGRLTIETANAALRAGESDDKDVTPGDYVMVSVRDTGTGIPKEIIGRIFEPFFTTKEVGKGTGLGLAQIFGFVKQSGGHMNVESEAGEGTTFRLYFPVAAAAAQPDATTATDESSDFAAGVVLLVEDEPSVLEIAVSMVESLGFKVLTAQNGTEALEVFAAHPEIDLLITDMILPGGMTGKEIATAMRKARPDLKVLFASGYTGGTLSRPGGLDETDVLLNKPFDESQLAQRLKQALAA